MNFIKKTMLFFIACLVFMQNMIAGESRSYSLKSLVTGISAVALTVWTGKKLYDSYQKTKQELSEALELTQGHVNNMNTAFTDSINYPEVLESIRTMLIKNNSGYIETYDHDISMINGTVEISPDEKCGVCHEDAAVLQSTNDEIVILPCCRQWLCKKDFLKNSKATDACPFCRVTPYPQEVFVASLRNKRVITNERGHPKKLKFISLLPDGQICNVQGQLVLARIKSTKGDRNLETSIILAGGYIPKFE